MHSFKLFTKFLAIFLLLLFVGVASVYAQGRDKRGKARHKALVENSDSTDVRRTILDSLKNDMTARSLSADSLVKKDLQPLDTDSLITGQDSLPVALDSLPVALDSLAAILQDTTALSDSLSALDSLGPKPEGGLEAPAFSTARDSVIEDFTGGKNMIYYYGDVTVTYDKMKLTADYMEYDVDKQTVFADGITDSTGTTTGKPVMTEGDKTYEMDQVFYNFGSRKARIKNVITKENDGILHGEKIKMLEDQSINISGGKYTVCDYAHPHYYLKMTAAKVETKPKQKTVFGPAYVVLEDVPLPLVLPFGFVPSTPARASGILFPTFGEEEARGFYLRDGGFYFAMGDYLDVALTGDYYTLGSWSAKLTSRYKWRYHFDGSLNITYSNDQTGDKGSTDFFQTKNFGVQWTHSQDSKAHPGTSFRASVNFSSPSNNTYNSRSVQQALENQVSSSISYSKTWSKMSLSINGLHSQNSRDSSYAITLPNLTFTVNKFYPFRRKERVGKERFYEKFSLSYNTSFQNKINFKASECGDPDFWDKLKTGMSHKFSIGLPSFTLLKYINFSPSVSYGMNWFFQSQSRYYNPETDKVETISTKQFGDFGATHDFSASVSMSTRIYGTFNVRNPHSKLRAVRHVITPSVGFNYKPEHGTMVNGYQTYTYLDKNGIEKSVDYNKWSGGINSVPSKGKAAAVSFSVGNNIEAKVADKKDTTGVGTKKVKILDQLNLSGNYNFMADSMKLSTISISASTNVLQKVSLQGNMTLDPYAVDGKGKRYNEFNIVREGGFKIARLTNASASASFNISGEGKTKGNDGTGSGSSGGSGSGGGGGKGSGVGINSENSPYTRVYYHPITGEYIPGGWVYYMNTTAPWSVNFSYSFAYSKSYTYANDMLQVKDNFTQTLGLTAQIKLTKDLNINLSSGVDLTKLKITTTQLSATYDLHCFQISVSYVPSGQWAQWSFRINAKASALADLLQYKKSSSYWDNK